MNFKERQPKLKVSLAVGGWNEGSGKYSNMSSTPENRKAFIDSVLVFLKYDNYRTSLINLNLFIYIIGSIVLTAWIWIGNILAFVSVTVSKIAKISLLSSRFYINYYKLKNDYLFLKAIDLLTGNAG